MPKMMPPDFDPEWSPVSEEIVFRAVQEYLSDDWYVLHSFHFTSDDPQGKKKDGEIDFLFYNPAEGIVVMEVKGGAISYHDNQWYQDNRPIDSVSKVKRVLELFLIIFVIGPLMNYDRTEYQKHFSHACDAYSHFLFAFFEEAFLKLLKCWDFWDADNRVQVQYLTNSAGRLSAHVRRVNA